MTECIITRYNTYEKWLELWLDGIEYKSDETIWCDKENKSIPTGRKQWNFCCKLGTFIDDYNKETGETINIIDNFHQIIGMKVLLGKRNDQGENPEDKIFFIREQNCYQELFNYMYNEHNVTLLENDMNEIINIVNKMQK